jgi:hypothetical protein
MQEYLFDKEALRRLIEKSSDNLNRIAVRVNLNQPQETIWARPVRFEAGSTFESSSDSAMSSQEAAPIEEPLTGDPLEEATMSIQSDGAVPGCPNPPGC